MSNSAIEDYAVIGNGRSTALVSRDGAIDWLCWPRPDSPSLFAAILDPGKGGHFRVAPAAPYRARRAYVDDTNVLVTTFEVAGGEARLTDLMPVLDERDKRTRLVPEHEILRVVECSRGAIELVVDFQPRPHYARRAIPLRRARGLGFRIEDGPRLFTLRADRELRQEAPTGVTGRWTLRAGERAVLSLTFDHEGPAVLPPLGDYAVDAIHRSADWWRAWAARCTYDGPFRAPVVRSALALKLLSYAPSGAIIAAPTTSLPERIGGDLNWDYRFCWLRDASLTVRSLFDLGYVDEALAFMSWLLHTTRLTRPELRVLYDVYGAQPGAEQNLDHLDGYGGSRPVRIRNGAVTQLQLDGYGEVIDALADLCQRGTRLDRETQRLLRDIGNYVAAHWQLPDQGIWELREPPKHHTHSRLLCWVVLDRLVALGRGGFVRGLPIEELAAQRQRIRDDIEGNAWNAALASYTEVLGGDTVDASVLLFGWYGFTKPGHPRMRATHKLVWERLGAGPGLLYRNELKRREREGAFGICSMWAAEYLAGGGGSLEDAEHLFENFLRYGNDVGLYAEEIDPATGAALGNFPQAFTHVGLISAALAIEERRRGAARPELLHTGAGPLPAAEEAHP